MSYRYELHRGGWMGGSGRLCWIMLNPSTADETTDDPTIRRVIRFTRDAGYAELVVVNLFALRATDPKELLAHPEPVGPGNASAVSSHVLGASAVVLAWGAVHARLRWRADWTRDLVADLATSPALCLGTTKNGDPRHPLYVPAAQPFVPFGSEVPGVPH